MEIVNKYDISIITPFYEGNKYINRLAENIKNNVGNLKVEWIIINDSPLISIVLKKKYNFDIHYIFNKTNQGIHQSRVNGINHAKGKYILMLDQDDLLLECALENLYSNIQNYDMIVGNGFDENPNSYGEIYHSSVHQKIVLEKKYYYAIGNTIVSPGQCLIRKEIIPHEWMDYIISENGSDDLLLWLILLSKDIKIKLLNKPVYIHSFTGKNVSYNYDKIKNSTLDVLNYLKSLNIANHDDEILLKKRLNMLAIYNNKSKIWKILAYLKYPEITKIILKMKRM